MSTTFLSENVKGREHAEDLGVKKRIILKFIKIYKIVILPFVLYGCETWSLTLKEEHRLSFFENKC